MDAECSSNTPNTMRCDIAVVGGGPAGLSAAWSAAKKGCDVVVLEKDEAIAHSIRTSGVSWIQEIEKFGITSEFYNPISNYRFVSPANDITITGAHPSSCVLDVRRTYQHLAFQAAEAGAKIMLRSSVSNVVLAANGEVSGVKVNTPRGEFTLKSTLVIDASGFSSTVARKAGLGGEWKRYGVGAEYECYCDKVDRHSWTLMVGQLYSEAGYAWVFPLSEHRVRIGVGIGKPESSAEPLSKLHTLIEKKLKPLDQLGKLQPIELHYGFIPNEGLRKSTIADGLIVVGDAAGQANPLVLEGIRYAIEFGRLAGDVGAGSLAKNSSSESLKPYENVWRSKIESKIISAIKVQSRWLGLSDSDWDKELEILRGMSSDEFVDFIKADFTAGKMMKLALHHPGIAARQLFNLVLGGR